MKLVEGVDYTWESDRMVLSEKFLLERGFCCKSRCRNCPYLPKNQDDHLENKEMNSKG
jgi:hypothetical protein